MLYPLPKVLGCGKEVVKNRTQHTHLASYLTLSIGCHFILHLPGSGYNTSPTPPHNPPATHGEKHTISSFHLHAETHTHTGTHALPTSQGSWLWKGDSNESPSPPPSHTTDTPTHRHTHVHGHTCTHAYVHRSRPSLTYNKEVHKSVSPPLMVTEVTHLLRVPRQEVVMRYAVGLF